MSTTRSNKSAPVVTAVKTAPSRVPASAPGSKRAGDTSAVGPRRRRGASRGLLVVGAVIGLAVLGLGVIFAANSAGRSTSGGGLADKYSYQVGNPGPGQPAPPIRLPSTSGGTFDLASLRNQTVLLYFQEGVMCPPCWDQLKEIEARWPEFQALGIERIVSITTDPTDVLKQKVAAEGLTTPILSDPDVAVSKTYEANRYGMMGMGMNGHSFVLVNKEGVITWRRDYGGPPKYTMYVPVPNLLADLKVGQAGGSR